MHFRKQLFFLLFLSGLIWIRASGQGWVVPEDQKGKLAPVKFTPEMQKQGEGLYLKNCQSCHGIPGKKNWAKITPPPGDLSAEKAQKQSDGEIFYRITSGKTPMPEFRNILSETERWAILSFLRSYNRAYIQPNPIGKTGFSGKKVRMTMNYHQAENKLVVQVKEITKDHSEIPLKGAEILVFVKRYFGNMQVGEPKTTGKEGLALIDFPPDLPGDKQGNLAITARVNDPDGNLTGAQVTDTLKIGVPTDKPSLIAQRAWWATRDKAPVWVILTYSISVILVWGFILYIIYTVLKIRKINK